MAIVFDTNLTTGYTRKTVADSSTNAAIVGDKPSSLVEGDLLLAVLTAGNLTGTNTFTPPAGFTEIFNNQTVNTSLSSGGQHTYVAYKFATASEPSNYTFGVAENLRDDQLILMRVTGVHPSVLSANAVGNIGNSTSPSSPSVSTVNANDVAVFIMSQANGGAMATPDGGNPAGTSLLISKNTRAHSSGTITGMAYQVYASPTETGPKEWTNYVTSTNKYSGVSFVLRDADGTAPPAVTTTGTVIPGSSHNWTTSNFSPAVNAGTVDGVALQSVSSTAFTLPSYTDGQPTARPGFRAIVPSNGTQTASSSVDVGVIANHDYTVLSGTLNTGTYSWIKTIVGVQAGDFIVYPTTVNGEDTGTVINSDGTGSTNVEGSQIIWHINNTTKIATQYSVTTGPVDGGGGEEPVVIVKRVSMVGGWYGALQQLAKINRPKLAFQANSTATTVAGFRTDLNALLQKMRDAGWFEEDEEEPV